jgi:hypothetical protein
LTLPAWGVTLDSEREVSMSEPAYTLPTPEDHDGQIWHWIVDPKARRVVIHTLSEDRYVEFCSGGVGETVTSVCCPAFRWRSRICSLIDPRASAEGRQSVADVRQSVADDPQALANRPQIVADDWQRVADSQQTFADRPQVIADDRQRVADPRQMSADHRQGVADGRQRVADDPPGIADGRQPAARRRRSQ